MEQKDTTGPLSNPAARRLMFAVAAAAGLAIALPFGQTAQAAAPAGPAGYSDFAQDVDQVFEAKKKKKKKKTRRGSFVGN